jgi:ribonucleoside-diphosphate reductase alpha chain
MELEQWLPIKLSQDIWTKKYRYNNETLDGWFNRVSGGNKEVKRLIQEKKFLFGGRTLSNRNTGKKASYSNCYSSGYVEDSLEGIMDLAKNIAMTYKSQGGQGLSLSKIRPKGTKISGEFESDGIVPFMRIYNEVTKSISQGGSRKGALMMSLSAKHKEIETFIDIKSHKGEIEKANLSVEIDDEFMNAVNEYYSSGKVVKLNIKENYEGNVVEYTITPIEIYKKIMQRAYDWGEPGVILTNRFRNYNLMEFIDEYEIVTGNPCGEQPLPQHGACNLGSMNLSAYVVDSYKPEAYFDLESFCNDVGIAIEGLDEVLEEGKDLHALQEQREMASNYRNVGLGIMGLGDMFFKLGITYGSEKSKSLFDRIMSEMFKSAVKSSVNLARIKGSFPKYTDKVFDSKIIRNHFDEEEIKEFKKYGIRNCSLLSIAPAGSIGTMLDVTTGVEPAFEVSYQRKTESLHKDQEVTYTVFLGSAKEYLEINNTDILPEYFVTAKDINWRNRIDIQAIAQEHVDTAISSTINLAEQTPLSEIEQLYLYAWKSGLKGITIFRSGCKRESILHSLNSKDNKEPEQLDTEIPRGFIEDVPEGLTYRKYKLRNGCGKLYFFVGVDETEGKIYDVFTNTDAVGGCSINTQANSRLLSAGLRGGIPVKYLVEQLEKSGSCPSYQSLRGKQQGMTKVRNMILKDVSLETIEKIDELIGTPVSAGKSCPSSIAVVLNNILKEFSGEEYERTEYQIANTKEIQKIKKLQEVRMEECKHPNMRTTEGCAQCPDCGYSKCGD